MGWTDGDACFYRLDLLLLSHVVITKLGSLRGGSRSTTCIGQKDWWVAPPRRRESPRTARGM
jgi:hypothetical protein